jgi:hypothetical protein
LATTPATFAISTAGAQMLQLLQQGLLVSTSAALQQLAEAAHAAAALEQIQPGEDADSKARILKARREALLQLHVARRAVSDVLKHSSSMVLAATQAAVSWTGAGPLGVLQTQLRALYAAAALPHGSASKPCGAPGKQTTTTGNTSSSGSSNSNTGGSSSSSSMGGRIGCYTLQEVHQALSAVGLPVDQLMEAVQLLAAAVGTVQHMARTAWLSFEIWDVHLLEATARTAQQGLALQQVWVLEQALLQLSSTVSAMQEGAAGASSSSSSKTSHGGGSGWWSVSSGRRKPAASTSSVSGSTQDNPCHTEQALRLLLAALTMVCKQQELCNRLDAARATAEDELCGTEAAIVGYLRRAHLQLSDLGAPAVPGQPRLEAWQEQMLMQMVSDSQEGVEAWLCTQPAVLDQLQDEENVTEYVQLLRDQPVLVRRYWLLHTLVCVLQDAIEPAAMQLTQLMQQLSRLQLRGHAAMADAALGGLQEPCQSEQGSSSSSRMGLLGATFSSWASSLQHRVQQQLQQPWPHEVAAVQGTFLAVRDLLCEVELLLAAGGCLQDPAVPGHCMQLQQAWQQLWEALFLLREHAAQQQVQALQFTAAEAELYSSASSNSSSNSPRRRGEGGTTTEETLLQRMERLAGAAEQTVPAGLEGLHAVAHLLAQYHQQLGVLQRDWFSAQACQDEPEGSVKVIRSYRQVLLTRGQLEAVLRGGGVSAAQRMRLLNLLGPSWWQLGSRIGQQKGVNGQAGTEVLWPWPSSSALPGAGAASTKAAGGSSAQEEACSTWLVELWHHKPDVPTDAGSLCSSLGSSIPLPIVLVKGVRVQGKQQLTAMMKQQQAVLGRAGQVGTNKGSSLLQHLEVAIDWEGESGLWEAQRLAAAATALPLLAAQGLLLPAWSLWDAAGRRLTVPGPTTSYSSSSSSTAGVTAGADVPNLLRLGGVDVGYGERTIEEGDLVELVWALPPDEVEQVSGVCGGGAAALFVCSVQCQRGANIPVEHGARQSLRVCFCADSVPGSHNCVQLFQYSCAWLATDIGNIRMTAYPSKHTGCTHRFDTQNLHTDIVPVLPMLPAAVEQAAHPTPATAADPTPGCRCQQHACQQHAACYQLTSTTTPHAGRLQDYAIMAARHKQKQQFVLPALHLGTGLQQPGAEHAEWAGRPCGTGRAPSCQCPV